MNLNDIAEKRPDLTTEVDSLGKTATDGPLLKRFGQEKRQLTADKE